MIEFIKVFFIPIDRFGDFKYIFLRTVYEKKCHYEEKCHGIDYYSGRLDDLKITLQQMFYTKISSHRNFASKLISIFIDFDDICILLGTNNQKCSLILITFAYY